MQTLRLPSGAQVEQLCPGAEQTLGAASFSVSCAVEGDVLTHRLEMNLPPQRIAPDDYRAFAELLRSYDEAAASETRILLR